ncbi:tRNA(fMet)-specific endonuclease VapC [Desulfonatronum zhilinae]|nr:tRNA(fMet)-specific endonuclease VapC [Desulfonatronum zhilinae]
MKYLLDTNSIITLFKGEPIFLERMRRHRPTDFGVPAIVIHELYYGAYKSRRVTENRERVSSLRFNILSFDTEDARRAGEIRATLSAQGTPIGPYDVLIAGQAMARGLTLITNNRREFERVHGFRLEDWLNE